MQLEGKVALVTGGARAGWAGPWPWPMLGKAPTLAWLPVHRRSWMPWQARSGPWAAGLHTVNAELTTSEGAARAVDETVSNLGKIDILVNNAGGYRLFTKDLTHSVTVLDITPEEWSLVMESNLTTTFMGDQGSPASHDRASRRGHRQHDVQKRCSPRPGGASFLCGVQSCRGTAQ